MGTQGGSDVWGRRTGVLYLRVFIYKNNLIFELFKFSILNALKIQHHFSNKVVSQSSLHIKIQIKAAKIGNKNNQGENNKPTWDTSKKHFLKIRNHTYNKTMGAILS